MNRRRIGLAAFVVGAGAVVARRMRTQADPGPASNDSPAHRDVAHGATPHTGAATDAGADLSNTAPMPDVASDDAADAAAAAIVEAVQDVDVRTGLGDAAAMAPEHSGASVSRVADVAPEEDSAAAPDVASDDDAAAAPDVASDDDAAAAIVEALQDVDVRTGLGDAAAAPEHSGAGVSSVAQAVVAQAAVEADVMATEAAAPMADVMPAEAVAPMADVMPAEAVAPTIVLPTMPAAGTRRIDQPPSASGQFVTSSAATPDSASPSATELSIAAAPLPKFDTMASTPAPSSPPTDPVSTAATPAPASPTPTEARPVPRRRRRGWRIFGGLMGGLLIVAFIAASSIRLPYYSLKPGSVYDTIERVEAPGDMETFPSGEIGFVTVSQTANITPWQWLDAKLDSNVRIQHEDEVRGDQTADELRQADLRRMQVSKNSAVVVALQRLGFDLVVTPIGIEVAQVFACTAADGTLGTGDLIVGVNGNDVRDGEQLVEQLTGLNIGDNIELLVERIDPANPTQSMRTDLVGLTLGSADAACLPEDVRADEARPFIGIGTLTIVDENFPVDVDVRTGQVSGPSAGLAFTLAIIDVLSVGELTNGLNVVATGTIDRDGNVGPVGGIHQKTVAAERSGADVFLVPMCCDNFVDSTTGEPLDLPSNYEEALLYADDMLVVGVDNLDDALIALGKLGGDVDQFLTH